MVKSVIWAKSISVLKEEKQVKPIGFEAPRGGAYNNRKHLKLEILCRAQTSANDRLCRMHNIQAYFGKFSLIVMFPKFWPLANLSRSKIKVQVIFGAAFHKLKYEWSLKSLWQLDAKL